MEQSKKGACSSNTQTAKANCLAHNRRDNSTEKVPSYVNQNRSHLNRTIFEDELIKGRKSIVPLIHAAEKLYTEKIGQKCQKSFAPFREACLHLKEGITDEQLMDFKSKVERETEWKVIGIWLHEDEGHAKSKYIEGEEGFEINHHAHVLFSCQDLTTGKAIRADRKKLSKMQDILAEATGMERGNKASETGRRHRSAMEQRIYIQEQRIAELEECTREMETEMAVVEEKRKELWKEFSFVSKKNKEQSSILYSKTKELEKVNLSLSDGRKELSTIKSSIEEINALKTQKNDEIRDLERRIEERKEKLRREPLEITTAKQQGREEGRKMAVSEILNTAGLRFGDNAAVTTEMVGKDWRKKFDQAKESEQDKMQKAYSLFQYVANAVDAIRTFVFKIRYNFSEEEEEDIYKALDGKADNAPALRKAAYNLGGAICQYQYASKWDQAERELVRIANGQEQQQNYERERGRGL